MGQAKFSEDFKQDAVHQITVQGYALREVSERLGLSTHSLYKWIKIYAQAASQATSVGAVRRTRTRIRLLTQPESMRSIIDATQQERRFG